MAIMNPKKAMEQLTLSSFGGIQGKKSITEKSAFDMRNFRILPDGSLEKRSAFRSVFNLRRPIRGFWEGTVEGRTLRFAVAGSGLYRLMDDMSAISQGISLTESSEPVSFVFYADVLYLFDGNLALRYRPSSESFVTAEGYIPLYGKEWSPSKMGEVHEGMNLVSDHLRIHYLNLSGETVFRLPYSGRKIDSLKINGKTVTDYTFTEGQSVFRIPTPLAAESNVEVCYTLGNAFCYRSRVLKAGHADVYRDPYHETLMMFGGIGYTLYISTPVSDGMLNGSRMAFTASDKLYICENTAFTVGSLQHPITALCQCGEQMLVFNDRTLWSIRYPDRLSSKAEIVLISDGIGCSSVDGVTLCGKDPVTIQESGISRLSFKSGDPDFCTSELLSSPISDRLSPSLLIHAALHYRKSSNELWVRDVLEKDGTVWVYSFDRDNWVCFDGIAAIGFYEQDGVLMFGTMGGKICAFDGTYDTDDGKPVRAYYESHYLCFSRPEFFKRAIRSLLCADIGTNSLSLEFRTERNTHTFHLKGSQVTAPELFDQRLAPGRFRFLRFRIFTSGPFRTRIHFLSLAANN